MHFECSSYVPSAAPDTGTPANYSTTMKRNTVTTDLVTIEPQAISPYEDPEEVVVRATAWANSLMDLVPSR
jgi:hypothetical protein